MIHKNKVLKIGVIFLLVSLLLAACGNNNTINIDAPDDIAALLNKGMGDNYTYYALKDSIPANWDDISKGTLWICSENERPALIPKGVANMIDGGGFLAGTLLTLSWTEQPGTPDSTALDINSIITTIGVTYEGCTEGALEALQSKSANLLLTEIDGVFDGKNSMVIVKFD